MTPPDEHADHDHGAHEAPPMDLSRYEGVEGAVVRDVSRTERELLAVVPAARYASSVEAEARALAKRVTLKGFRPGKAPVERVRKLHDDEIRRRAVERLVAEVWQEARAAHELMPIADPVITEISAEPDQPVRFAARFEVLPEVALQGIDEIRVSDKVVEVTDKQVDDEIEALRQLRGELVPSERTEAAPGDFVVVDLERWPPGADRKAEPAVERKEGVLVQVGHESNIPELDRALLGMTPGESREATAKNPSDHRDPSLAGAAVPLRVTLRGIKDRKLPDLDDEFGRSLGFDSLSAFRGAVRKRLLSLARDRARHEQEAEAIEQLLARNPCEVPRSLVEQEAEARLRKGLEDMARRGVDIERLSVDWKGEFERVREAADRDLRADWLLELIARERKIEVTEDEVEAEVKVMAERRRMPADVLRAQLRQAKQWSAVRASLRRGRVLDLLRSGATITET